MADQNRKTPQEIRLRERAMEIVESYLDFLFAVKDVTDIASEGRCLLGIYSEHGEIPRGSGFSGFCRLAGTVDRIRNREITSRMIEAEKILSGLESGQRTAVCIDRHFRGKTKVIATDPLNGKHVEITFRAIDCAEMLGIDEPAYRKRVSRGYQVIESALQSNKQVA